MTEKNVEKALGILVERGVRITPQRKIILEYLVTQHNHPSVEQIFNGIKDDSVGIGIATVYNTLQVLVAHKLVIELSNSDDGKMHYDYFGEPHYHAICLNCGKITDIFTEMTFPKVELEAAQKSGYIIESTHVETYGYCPECQVELGLVK
ncbi:Fur family transcriptional regulator [Dellaglioa sp. BT-FLS60]